MVRTIFVSVVVPVFDGKRQLEQSLPALQRAGEGVAHELIVVDDGSTDGSADYARSLGATVMSSGGRKLGPAAARNVGVAEAAYVMKKLGNQYTSDIYVIFIEDSDGCWRAH